MWIRTWTRAKLYTLFRTESSKAIPCPAAHPHTGHIREYPPPPATQEGISGKDRVTFVELVFILAEARPAKMLTVEEKGPSHTSITSPRRRYLIIALVAGFLVITTIGIVAGYFIGRSSVKSCKERESKQQQLDEFHKNAVEMVSTRELRDNLE